MDFKAMMDADIKEVFINEDEFAEWHTINGQQILMIVDNDRLFKRMQGEFGNVVECDLLFFCKVSELNLKLRPGSVITYDNQYSTIIDVKEVDGRYEVILQFNRGQ